MGEEMANSILRTTCDFHGECKDLLHAAKLRHGTDGFTSPPKEGVLRILTPRSRVLLEKLPFPRLVKKFPTFTLTEVFINLTDVFFYTD
jgi:hypothetical protein